MHICNLDIPKAILSIKTLLIYLLHDDVKCTNVSESVDARPRQEAIVGDGQKAYCSLATMLKTFGIK